MLSDEVIVILLAIIALFDFLRHQTMTEQIRNQRAILRALKRKPVKDEDEE